MAQKLLTESGARLREATAGKWRVTLLTPGQGSSANYGEEVLERDAAAAFPAGTKLWWGHPKEWESAGDRDARDQWGRLDEPAFYTPGVGIEADVTLKKHWQDVVESLGEDAELSVYVLAHVDEEGAVTHLLPERTNSCDIVSYPGRPGSGLKQKLEAARAASTHTPDAASAQVPKKEGIKMEEELKALKKAVETLAATLTSFVDESKTAAAASVKAEADADAIEDAQTKAVEAAVASYDEKIKVIDAVEGLLPSQVASLREAAREGKDIAPLVESAKKTVSELKEALQAAPTGYRLAESTTGDAKQALPKGW